VGRRSAGRKLDVEERRGIIELQMKKMSAIEAGNRIKAVASIVHHERHI
jgi:hypothetical protein